MGFNDTHFLKKSRIAELLGRAVQLQGTPKTVK